MDLSTIKNEKRISLDTGLDAYQETGMTPGFGSFGHDDKKGCGISAVALACSNLEQHFAVRHVLKSILGESYFFGFTVGFDNRPDVPGSFDREDWNRGYTDGQRLRKAIKAGALEPVDVPLEENVYATV